MTVQEFYDVTGGDYQGVSELLMSDELIMTFLKKFSKSCGYDELEAAVCAGDIEQSFRAAHTLKGTSANIRLTRLQDAASDLTEQLRPRTAPADEALMELVRVRYREIMEAIERLCS